MTVSRNHRDDCGASCGSCDVCMAEDFPTRMAADPSLGYDAMADYTQSIQRYRNRLDAIVASVADLPDLPVLS